MTWRNLNDTGWERPRAGDPDGEVAAVWGARELLAEVDDAVDLAHARRRLIVFFQHAADTEISKLSRLARTIDHWRDEVLAYHTTGGASKGATEAVIPAHRENPAHRPRLPKFPELSTPPTPRLRHHRDYRSKCAQYEAANQRSPRRAPIAHAMTYRLWSASVPTRTAHHALTGARRRRPTACLVGPEGCASRRPRWAERAAEWPAAAGSAAPATPRTTCSRSATACRWVRSEG